MLRQPPTYLIPHPHDGQTLPFLTEKLRQIGYTEEALDRLLGGVGRSVRLDTLPVYTWLCDKDGTAVGQLAKLFVFRTPLPVATVESILGDSGLQTLCGRGLLRRFEGEVHSQVDVYPCGGRYFITDHRFGPGYHKEHVYDMQLDSYLLTWATPRRTVGKTLDLCTGSGLHAILASAHSQHALGIDINKRALSFSRINAALNEAPNCTFKAGDLYEAVGDEQFDLILSNPPWVPSPDPSIEFCRGGGLTGEAICRRIVEGLPRHLAPGGTLVMYANYPLQKDGSYLDRLQAWLGQSEGWGLAVLHNAVDMPTERYVSHHVGFDGAGIDFQAFKRWMDLYDAEGITAMATGLVFIRRLPAGAPGWQVMRTSFGPMKPCGERYAAWLDAVDRTHADDWTTFWSEWKPRLADGVDGLWLELGHRQRASASGDEDVTNLTADEATLASRLTGHDTAGQLADNSSRQHVQALLRELCRKGIVV